MACYDPAELTYDLQCPICFEDYDILDKRRIPKLLNCRHHFCVPCIVKSLDQHGSMICCVCSNIHNNISNPFELEDNYVITTHLRQIQERNDEEFAKSLQNENDNIGRNDESFGSVIAAAFIDHIPQLCSGNDLGKATLQDIIIQQQQQLFENAKKANLTYQAVKDENGSMRMDCDTGIPHTVDSANLTYQAVKDENGSMRKDCDTGIPRTVDSGIDVDTPGPSGISTISHNPSAEAQITSSPALHLQDAVDFHPRVFFSSQQQQQQQQQILSTSALQAESATTSPTSNKYQVFVSQPIGEKDVKALPGIGPGLGGQLIVRGFETANDVLMQFLVLKKNEEHFISWLNTICKKKKPTPKQAKDCYQCLYDYSEKFM